MRKFRLVAPVIAGILVLSACGGNGGGVGGDIPDGDGEIVVTSLWGGAEEEAFQAVLDAFEETSGITATYEANRTDYATVLRTRIQGGNPPDVAIIPGIGTLRSLARDGSLIPLAELGIDRNEIEDRYAPGLLDIGLVDGNIFALMVKVNSKAAIWYDPQRFATMSVAPVETWDDLVALSGTIADTGVAPWALGAGDSWTLTDWFEITYLKMHGTEAYDTLFSPEGDFTDSTVTETIDKLFGELLTADYVDGGIDGALSTLFVAAIGKVFSTSPSAEMYCCGGFVGGIATGEEVNPALAGTEGPDGSIAFFDYPTVSGSGEGEITYGGDVMAALVRDSDVAAFMEYLATPEAGEIWAAGGTIISPLVDVDTSVYPNANVQAEAEQIANASAVRFDGSDLLPGTDLGAVLQAAFRREEMGPVLEAFQEATQTAWDEE
jgi:alpha-glucoside transport system substrate-binding protein